MDINIYDQQPLTFTAVPTPPSDETNLNRVIIYDGAGSVVLWLKREQCNALRAELDKLYPPLADADEAAATDRYADEHASEVAA